MADYSLDPTPSAHPGQEARDLANEPPKPDDGDDDADENDAPDEDNWDERLNPTAVCSSPTDLEEQLPFALPVPQTESAALSPAA